MKWVNFLGFWCEEAAVLLRRVKQTEKDMGSERRFTSKNELHVDSLRLQEQERAQREHFGASLGKRLL